MFAQPDINKIKQHNKTQYNSLISTVMQTLDFVSGLHNCLKFSQPLSCLYYIIHIFNSVAEMVEWILVDNYQIPDLLHYLDDFITAGPPDSPQGALNLRTALRVSECLGQCMGPFPVMTVLGIQLDSLAQVARHLPDDKLLALQNMFQSWLPRKWCTRRDLKCLFGHLHHAAKVVSPGRTFLCRMIDLLCCVRTKEFHLDLQW